MIEHYEAKNIHQMKTKTYVLLTSYQLNFTRQCPIYIITKQNCKIPYFEQRVCYRKEHILRWKVEKERGSHEWQVKVDTILVMVNGVERLKWKKKRDPSHVTEG